MGICIQCKKWIRQTEGKRKKEFCNNTCRSNYWYGKNKKGKQGKEAEKDKDLIQHTNTERTPLKTETNFSPNVPARPSRLEIEAIKQRYVEDRRDCTCREDYLAWLARVENDDRLSRNDRELVKNTH